MLQCKDCSIKHRPDYTISRELFVQQLVSVQSTDHYTENKTFNFANLFDASWDLNQARIGRRNGMIFCMGSTYGSLVVCRWSNFLMVKELHDFVLEFRFGHCELIRRTLGAESTCVEFASTISLSRSPTRSLGHYIGNVLQVHSFRQLLNCCEERGPLGCAAFIFP